MTFDARADVFTLTGAGLGEDTTTVHIGEHEVISVDVNADHGRSFDATVRAQNDIISIGVSPLLMVAVAFEMRNVDLDTPEWMKQERMGVTFDGDDPTISLGDSVQVTSGHLQFTSTNFGDVDIEAGMCIENVDVEDADGHPFAGLVAEVCE
jgi:hypothetical protein